MRSILLSAFLVLLSFSVSGQTYQPLLGNPSWNITVANFGGAYNVVIPQGIDETMGILTYKKFHDPIFNNDVFLREDVSTQRVYRLVDNAEELLYDFSVQNLDMITLPNGNTYTAYVTTTNVEG